MSEPRKATEEDIDFILLELDSIKRLVKEYADYGFSKRVLVFTSAILMAAIIYCGVFVILMPVCEVYFPDAYYCYRLFPST